MDELMISGRRYLSSLRAAKEHGYHSDYIGQLIRGNKVKGQKVGRAWYVDAESLATYLGKETLSAQEVRVVPEEKMILEPEIVEKKVEAKETVGGDPEEYHIPIVKAVEIKEPVTIISTSDEKKKRGLTYVADDSPLLPEIRKKQKLSHPPEAVVQNISLKTNKEKSPRLPRRTHLWQGLALAGLGVLVLIAVTAISILFVSQLSVGTTKSANVQFSLPN